jgi:chromosome segregation ATPase
MRCTDVPHTSVDLGVESIADDTKAVGLVTRLENRINALDHRRDELQAEADRLTVEIDRAQRRIGTEFPQAGELSATKLRAADIEARLTEAARPRAAEPTADHDDTSIAADYSAGTDLAGDIGPDLGVDDEWNAP